jgi:hypothetical protein
MPISSNYMLDAENSAPLENAGWLLSFAIYQHRFMTTTMHRKA